MNPHTKNKAPLSPEAQAKLSEWGRQGGQRRAQVLSPAKRRQIARMGKQAQIASITKKA